MSKSNLVGMAVFTLASLMGCEKQGVDSGAYSSSETKSILQWNIEETLATMKIMNVAKDLENVPVIVDKKGCFWGLDERKDNSGLTLLKIAKANGKQFCISKKELDERKAAESASKSMEASASQLTFECIESTRFDARQCENGVGQYLTTIKTRLVNGQCSTTSSTDMSTCASVSATSK